MVVAFDHASAPYRVDDDLNYSLNGGFRNPAIDFNEIKSQRSDVGSINAVAIDQGGNPEVKGLQQGIAKTFNKTGVRDEISVDIGVPQSIDFLALTYTGGGCKIPRLCLAAPRTEGYAG